MSFIRTSVYTKVTSRLHCLEGRIETYGRESLWREKNRSGEEEWETKSGTSVPLWLSITSWESTSLCLLTREMVKYLVAFPFCTETTISENAIILLPILPSTVLFSLQSLFCPVVLWSLPLLPQDFRPYPGWPEKTQRHLWNPIKIIIYLTVKFYYKF